MLYTQLRTRAWLFTRLDTSQHASHMQEMVGKRACLSTTRRHVTYTTSTSTTNIILHYSTVHYLAVANIPDRFIVHSHYINNPAISCVRLFSSAFPLSSSLVRLKDTGATGSSKCISDSNVRSSDHNHDRNVYGYCLLGWYTVESTGSLNALTVLSCALSPCPASSSQTTNALSVLSSAQATYSPVTSPKSYSFPPALYSSYGLVITSAVDSQSISSTGTSEVASTAVGPVTSSETSPATYSGSSAATTETTTVPSSAAPATSASSSSMVSPETTSMSSSGTTAIPAPVPSSTSVTASTSGPVTSSEAGAGSTMTTSVSGSSMPAAYTSTSSEGESTANPAEATSSSVSAASTTPAPPAPTNAAVDNEMPAAMGGLAAAMVAHIFDKAMTYLRTRRIGINDMMRTGGDEADGEDRWPR
ncbi:hypothetical protein KC360_g185 [Hortaea werneckii]|nr:hypothetical protein KC360_g185 [Hortaea werneckii]